MKVAIIGAGEIGQAIAHVISSYSAADIILWDKDESKIPDQPDLKDLVPTADTVFMCIPSWAMRAGLTEIKEANLNPRAFIISIAKGVERETNQTRDQVIDEAVPNQIFAVLGGPLLAEEITADMAGMGVLATGSQSLADSAHTLFSQSRVKLEDSADVRGVAVAGVLKNVYALGLGMVAGLNLGHNFRGWFVRQALSEMRQAIMALGGQGETAYGSAGAGDLIATGFSSDSSNYQTGKDLAEQGSTEKKSEGYVSLPQVLELLGDTANKLKLMQAVKEVVIENKSPAEVYAKLP
jgi:glycerol-3-phosphate dehydrogenase (NAD(P)+)